MSVTNDKVESLLQIFSKLDDKYSLLTQRINEFSVANTIKNILPDAQGVVIEFQDNSRILLPLTHLAMRGATGDRGAKGDSIRGKQGRRGAKGDSIVGQIGLTGRHMINLQQSEDRDSAIVYMNDGESYTLYGLKGADGKAGIDGKDGKDGRGLTDRFYVLDGNLYAILNTEEHVFLGYVQGEKGEIGKSGADGKDGRDGAEAEGIKDIIIDDRGHKILITTRGRRFDLTVVTINKNKRISGGGSPIVDLFTLKYTNPEKLPEQVGGFPAGTTFNQMPIWYLITGLYYFNHEANIFTVFNVENLEQIVEVGSIIQPETYSATWAVSDPNLLLANSVTIAQDDQIISSNINESPTDITLVSTPTVTRDKVILSITGTDTTNRKFSSDYVIKVLYRIYYGSSDLDTLAAADVNNLPASIVSETQNEVYEFIGNGYKWICYPVFMGARRDFLDMETSLNVVMEDAIILSVTNKYGIAADYYCYRSLEKLDSDMMIWVNDESSKAKEKIRKRKKKNV